MAIEKLTNDDIITFGEIKCYVRRYFESRDETVRAYYYGAYSILFDHYVNTIRQKVEEEQNEC